MLNAPFLTDLDSRATVYGPEIGFRWTRTNYFRWVQSTKDAERGEQRQPDRKQDQIHVKKCKLVLNWFKQRAATSV